MVVIFVASGALLHRKQQQMGEQHDIIQKVNMIASVALSTSEEIRPYPQQQNIQNDMTLNALHSKASWGCLNWQFWWNTTQCFTIQAWWFSSYGLDTQNNTEDLQSNALHGKHDAHTSYCKDTGDLLDQQKLSSIIFFYNHSSETHDGFLLNQEKLNQTSKSRPTLGAYSSHEDDNGVLLK